MRVIAAVTGAPGGPFVLSQLELYERIADGTTALSRGPQPSHSYSFGQSSFVTAAIARERNVVGIESHLPLIVASPFGCDSETGAGPLLNTFSERPARKRSRRVRHVRSASPRCWPPSSPEPRRSSSCTCIPRLALARELGATDVIDERAADAIEQIRRLTGHGVDFGLNTTGVPSQ